MRLSLLRRSLLRARPSPAPLLIGRRVLSTSVPRFDLDALPKTDAPTPRPGPPLNTQQQQPASSSAVAAAAQASFDPSATPTELPTGHEASASSPPTGPSTNAGQAGVSDSSDPSSAPATSSTAEPPTAPEPPASPEPPTDPALMAASPPTSSSSLETSVSIEAAPATDVSASSTASAASPIGLPVGGDAAASSTAPAPLDPPAPETVSELTATSPPSQSPASPVLPTDSSSVETVSAGDAPSSSTAQPLTSAPTDGASLAPAAAEAPAPSSNAAAASGGAFVPAPRRPRPMEIRALSEDTSLPPAAEAPIPSANAAAPSGDVFVPPLRRSPPLKKPPQGRAPARATEAAVHTDRAASSIPSSATRPQPPSSSSSSAKDLSTDRNLGVNLLDLPPRYNGRALTELMSRYGTIASWTAHNGSAPEQSLSATFFFADAAGAQAALAASPLVIRNRKVCIAPFLSEEEKAASATTLKARPSPSSGPAKSATPRAVDRIARSSPRSALGETSPLSASWTSSRPPPPPPPSSSSLPFERLAPEDRAASKLDFIVRVANLPFNLDEQRLGLLMERFGTVKAVRILVPDKRATRQKSNNARVTFKDAAAARKGVAASPLIVDGRKIFISKIFVNPRTPPGLGPPTTSPPQADLGLRPPSPPPLPRSMGEARAPEPVTQLAEAQPATWPTNPVSPTDPASPTTPISQINPVAAIPSPGTLHFPSDRRLATLGSFARAPESDVANVKRNKPRHFLHSTEPSEFLHRFAPGPHPPATSVLTTEVYRRSIARFQPLFASQTWTEKTFLERGLEQTYLVREVLRDELTEAITDPDDFARLGDWAPRVMGTLFMRWSSAIQDLHSHHAEVKSNRDLIRIRITTHDTHYPPVPLGSIPDPDRPAIPPPGLTTRDLHLAHSLELLIGFTKQMLAQDAQALST